MIVDYRSKMINLVKGKRLLDIGMVGNVEREILSGHYRTRFQAASEAIGIDNNQRGVELARGQGVKNIFHCDICNVVQVARLLTHFGRFDIITATDVIEHLINHGVFLDNVRSLLAPGGVVVIVTVNAFSVRYFLKRLNSTITVNPEHVCWFDEITLRQLLHRKGFRAKEVFYAVLPSLAELTSIGIDKMESWMCKKVGVVAW